jgi:pimeloyl-ACP methyl ester carboxylesterase
MLNSNCIYKIEFWNFSWDEMALYDLPAVVNYILKSTAQKNLIYIGHSQGTLMGFAGLSKNSDLASKIKLFVALAPIVKIQHIKSPIKYLANMGISTNQQIWYDLFGSRDFMPSSIFVDLFEIHFIIFSNKM